MMANNKLFVMIAIVIIALLAACSPMAAEPGAGDASATASAAATAFLADELGIAPEDIEVVSAVETEFSDSCLGLGGPAESCAQVITPGWIVIADVAGETYEVHTDQTAEQVRLKTDAPVGDGSADPAVGAAQEFLASTLGVALGDVQVISSTATEFSDSCLGLGGPAESCLQAITPGWIVMVDVAGQTYEVHTDQTGQQVRLKSDLLVGDGAADSASAAAQAFLVNELGVVLGDVQVVSAEPAEFSDSCLGLGGPAELCAQVITPGWIVTAEVAGETYEVHTDQTGAQVRLKTDAPVGDGAGDTASAAAQAYLAAEMDVALGDVQVVSAEQTEFSDGCLGLGGPDESCLQAITPGWVVMLDVNGQMYEARTDETGQQVRIAR